MSIKQLKYLIIAGLFAVPFIPLIVSQSLLFPFITGKAFIFRLIVEIIFAAWLGLILKYPEYRLKFSWISVSVIAFVAIIGVADFFGVNPTKSFWSNFERMEGFISLLHFGMYFLVLSSVVKGREMWNKLIATSVFASAIMVIYSFLQIAGKITINQGGVRVDGTFGNSAYLAIYLVFNIFFAGFLFLRTQANLYRYLLGVAALGQLVVLYYTATRGAILGLLGGALITFIFFLVTSEKGDKIRKFALVSIVSLLALVGVFLISKNNSYVKNNLVLGRFATLSFSEIKTQGRYYVWPIAWKGFLEKPLLGWGQEGFNFVFNEHYNPDMYNQEPWFDRSHDIVLDWLIAGGLLGFLAYASLFISLFFSLFKKSNLSRSEKGVLVGLLAAYTFHNLFVFDQIGSYILFFLVLAFVHSSSEDESPRWIKSIGNKLQGLASNGMIPVSGAVIVLGTLTTLYFWNYIPWQQNKNIISILTLSNQGQIAPLTSYTTPLEKNTLGFPEALEHISGVAIQLYNSPQVDPALKTGLATALDDGFNRQLAEAPTDARYHLFYAMFLSGIGNSDAAITEYEAASQLSPNKQGILFELGSALLNAGHKEEAVDVFQKAYELAPQYEEAKFVYGLAALSNGDDRLANELFASFPKEKLTFDDRYLSVLASLKRYPEVVKIAESRIESDPVNMQYRITLAAAYLQSGQRSLAISTIQEMITLNPGFKEQGEYYISEIQAGRNP